VAARAARSLERAVHPGAAVSPALAFSGALLPTNLWFHRVHVGEGTADRLVLEIDDHYTDARELVDELRKQRRSLRLPRDKQTIESGGACTFGPVTLSGEGVSVRDRTLLWRDVEKLSLEQGQVVVTRRPRGRFAIVECREVPDVDVLFELSSWIPSRASYR
jgi:hypothetical protein